MMFLMILASTFYLWVKDVEIYLMDRAYRTVQYGLDHAVHDAALQVNKDALSDGKILFNELEAEEALRETLQKNLPVDQFLRPFSPIVLEGPLVIDEIIYADQDYINPQTNALTTFPFQWKFTLPSGEEFTRAVFGPSVILIVNVQVKGSNRYEPFVVIQEYKK